MTWHDDIRDTADALTEPTIHREPIRDWDHNRNPRRRYHQTIQPGLLTQLYQSVLPTWSTPDDTPTSSSKPGSRPPLALEALSTHHEISWHVKTWCTTLGLPVNPTAESNIRRLAGKAMSFDEPAGRTLLADLRRWRRWCLVMTGWEKITTIRAVPCPLITCRQPGTLRVNLTTASALCRACGATWSHDDHSLNGLIDYVERFTQPHAA